MVVVPVFLWELTNLKNLMRKKGACELSTLQIDWHSLIFCFSCDAQSNFWTVRRSFSRNSYGRYPYNVKFQNSEYEVHQVGLKDYESHFSFLAFKGVSASVAQILYHNGDGAWQTEIKSPKTWKSAMKNFHFSRHETNTLPSYSICGK
jgi:hypothetical protein